jgi:small conductance mechanosensitive channel
VSRIVHRWLDRTSHLSQLAETLIARSVRRVIYLLGILFALTTLGIDIGPLLAAVGATGFIVGFALQGTLSNFASGLMILVNRPFDVGDVVEAGGVTGTIAEMNLVSTTFKSFDNQKIIVPNNEIWDKVITNVTASSTRRVDLVFGCGYEDDVDRVEQVMSEVVHGHPLVLKEPEPTIKLNELGDSSVNFIVRPWANTADYWTVYWDLTRTIKKRFDEEGFSIPYPQHEVHVKNEPGSDSNG